MGFLSDSVEADLSALLMAAQREDGRGSATDKIIRRFEPLVARIGYRLAGGRPDREDVENAARLGLLQAVRRHRGDVAGFPSYAKKFAEGSAGRELRHWAPPVDTRLTPLGSAPDCAVSPPQPSIDETFGTSGWGHGATQAAVETLSPAQQQLLSRRYIDDADLADIAGESGTTVSAVSQRLTTAHRRLRLLLAA